jgi:hypothetical protein
VDIYGGKARLSIDLRVVIRERACRIGGGFADESAI